MEQLCAFVRQKLQTLSYYCMVAFANYVNINHELKASEFHKHHEHC